MTNAKHPPYPFFVDAKRYETDKASLTGLEIENYRHRPRQLSAVPRGRGR